MKLFIINREKFHDSHEQKDYRDGYYFTPKKIHQLAFNELQESIVEGNIPIQLCPPYKNTFCCAIFEFRSVKNDVYFYEYITSAS